MAGAAVAYLVGSFASTAIAGEVVIAGLAINSAFLITSATVIGGIGGAVLGGLAAGAINGSPTGGSAPSSVSSARAQGILINTSSNVEAIPVLYGTRKVGGSRVLVEASGPNNEYMHIVLVLAEGEIDSVTNIYINDVLSTDARYSGLVTTEVRTGTDAQAASAALIAALPTKWTAQHTGSGVADIYVRLTYSQSVFSGLPTIAADVRGKKVFDPRTSTTAWSNNPALCIRDYLTSTRYGRGLSAANIDDASFIAAANHCDELVAVPGGAQARYTCDGVVDINATAFDNLKSLLTSCRGMLIFSAGVFRLVIDKLTAPGFAFTENNITGEWTIAQPGRRSKYNRVTAGIFNAAKNWQPDFAITDSPAYRVADNNLLLEDKLDLPFTNNLYRGQQLAGLRLKQSRFGITVRFKALQEGLRAEVGDVVSITHTTPGWVAKAFRVMQMVLASDDEVEVTCAEYDDTVYALDALTAITGAPSSNLPDVFTVAAPGAMSVAETLYQTSGSVGVRSRATASWAAVADSFVNGYLPEYKPSSSSAWLTLGKVASPTINVDDLAAGNYDFRVRAENSISSRSAYSPTVTKELLGLSAPPATLTNLAVLAISGRAWATWDLSPDLDVRIGGRIIVRHSPLTGGAAWENGIILDDFNGDATTATLPLLTGTYMVKARDSSGNYSPAMASFVATESQVTGFTTVATSTQAPAFAGVKTAVAMAGATLKLDGVTPIDSLATLIDSWGYIDNLGGVALAGSYYFDAPINFGAVATRRLNATINALSIDTGDMIDDRGLLDDWDSVDGGVINDCDATLYYGLTQTDPAGSPVWSAYTPFMTADVTAWAVRLRLDLASASPVHNIVVSTLTVIARSSP